MTCLLLNGIDLPRTNNVAEGWHNAHASMTGVQREHFQIYRKFEKR